MNRLNFVLRSDNSVIRLISSDREHMEILRGRGCIKGDDEITNLLLNWLSAYEVKFFADAFDDNGNDAYDMITVYDVLNRLNVQGRTDDIYAYLKSKYISFGLEFPDFYDILHRHTPTFKAFIDEFLLDFADVIFERAEFSEGDAE